MFEFYTYDLPTNNPLLPQRSGLILSYKLDEKTFLAESSPLPGYNKESLQDVLFQLKEVLPDLLELWSLDDFNNWNRNHTLYPSLQFALYSIFSQISSPITYPFSIPIRRFINIPYENKNSNFNLLHKISALESSNCIKIKLGSYPLKEAISLMKSALSITKARLILDFNEKWSLENMQRFCDHFDLTSFKHLEDPLSNPLDLFVLAKTHPHPIALEQGLRSHGIQTFLSLPTLKACEFKPTIDMPLLKTKELFKKLSTLNIDVTFSSAYETSIGIACIGYLAYELAPNSYHGLDTLSMFKLDILVKPYQITPTHLIIQKGQTLCKNCFAP